MKQHLHQGWSLSAVPGSGPIAPELPELPLPATVPGCVHTDLLAAGLIPDPYRDRHEAELHWLGQCDWRYHCSFEVSPELLAQACVELVCEGLDTIARLELNGEALGEAANMHRPHRFDLGGRLRPHNDLVITFHSSLRYAEALRDVLGERPNVYPLPFNFVRKMACNFGWDWGPTLVTAGIWQPIYLEAWSGARIASLRPLSTLDIGLKRAQLALLVQLDWSPKASEAVRLEATVPRPDRLELGVEGTELTVAPGQREAVLHFAVDDPLLWWPRGHGQQPLYELELLLTDDGGRTLERHERRIGFRQIELDTSADAAGSRFAFRINGKEIFARGANWIPDDCFPTRVDEQRYRRRIRQACDANMNMLRVWGGGIYEQEAFYRTCDELGVMVWQDFLFACAAYPEEEPLRSEVEAEARHQVARLSGHPSLVLWNGNNENLWGHADWGWRQQLGQRSWGRGYYLDLLPRVVAELDPTRPYWPGSPYSGRPELDPNDDRYGTTHLWDAWNEQDYTSYRSHAPRFVAEFGHQAPPTYATLREALSDDPLTPSSPAMLHHQKALGGNDKLHARLAEHFRVPTDFDAWLYATQLNQARAVAFGVAHFRALQPHCMGTLYWQLNDCWPVTSWSAIDGYGRRKPLWYATRRVYADRLVTFQPRGEGLSLVMMNDSDQPWRERLTIERRTFDGGVVGALTIGFEIAAREKLERPVPTWVGEAGDGHRELIRARAGASEAWWFFGRDKELAYPDARYDTELRRQNGRSRFTVTAQTLLRDLVLYADALDPAAEVSEQLVTLLPGESFTFEIRSDRTFDEVELRARLRCANEL